MNFRGGGGWHGNLLPIANRRCFVKKKTMQGLRQEPVIRPCLGWQQKRLLDLGVGCKNEIVTHTCGNAVAGLWRRSHVGQTWMGEEFMLRLSSFSSLWLASYDLWLLVGSKRTLGGQKSTLERTAARRGLTWLRCWLIQRKGGVWRAARVEQKDNKSWSSL